MTAAEFDAATPAEIGWRIEGLAHADRAEWQRTAQLASWLFGAVGVKVSAKKLLGQPDDDWRGLLD